MDEKHTPGPWTATGVWTSASDDGWSIEAPGVEVAFLYRLPRRSNPEADARLVAAAPELLAALKLIVHHFGDPLKVARAAIAKAEGCNGRL